MSKSTVQNHDLEKALFTEEERHAMDKVREECMLRYGRDPEAFLMYDANPAMWRQSVGTYHGIEVWEYGEVDLHFRNLQRNMVYASVSHMPFAYSPSAALTGPEYCWHSWKLYIGFTDKYEYCENCNEKRRT